MERWSRTALSLLVLWATIFRGQATPIKTSSTAQGNVYSKEQKGTLGGIRRDAHWSGPLCNQVHLTAGEGFYAYSTQAGTWREKGQILHGSKGNAKVGVTLLSLEGNSRTMATRNLSTGLKWQVHSDLGIFGGYEVSAGQAGFTAKLEAGASARANLGAKVEVNTQIDGVEVKGTLGFGGSAGWAASIEAVVQANWSPSTDKMTRLSLKYGASNFLGLYSELNLEIDTSSLVKSVLEGHGLKAWAEYLRDKYVPARGIRWTLHQLRTIAKKAQSAMKDMQTGQEDAQAMESETRDPVDLSNHFLDVLSDRPQDGKPREDETPKRDAFPVS